MALAIDDAKKYVETIMSTQPVPVNIATDNWRKRHLSDSSRGHCSKLKKARNTEHGLLLLVPIHQKQITIVCHIVSRVVSVPSLQ